MRCIIYKDHAGEWRWHLKARNGRIIAESGEGYTRRKACERAAYRMAGADVASAFHYHKGPEIHPITSVRDLPSVRKS